MTKTTKHLLSLATCVFVLGACNFSSLRRGSENKADNSGTKSSSGGSPFTPSGDARKDLGDALEKLNSAYPYRLTETMSALMHGPNAMLPSKRVIEFQAADRTHMKYSGGGGDFEAISIGDKHYWYSNGEWTEESAPSQSWRG